MSAGPSSSIRTASPTFRRACAARQDGVLAEHHADLQVAVGRQRAARLVELLRAALVDVGIEQRVQA